jgi:phage tail sheath protein FI
MSVYVSPGVYTREIDLSLYVPALSTTIVGMVGVTTKGPTNARTYISNQQQFVEVFGNPDANLGFESYAALQYLRRGRQLWFVRVVGGGALSASESFSYATEVTTPETPVPAPPIDGIVTNFTLAAVSELGDSGLVPGSVEVTAVNLLAATETFTDDGLGVLTGDIDSTGTVDYVTGEIIIAMGASTIALGEDFNVTYSYISNAFDVTATSEGEWGDDIAILIEDGTQTGFSRLSVYYQGIRVERFDGINLDPTPGNTAYIETKINGVSDFITVTVDAAIAIVPGFALLPTNVLTPVNLAGGLVDAGTVNAGTIIGVPWEITLAQPTGMQLFASPSAVDINLLAVPGWSDAAVINEMIQLCETRADCLAIVDCPIDLRPQEVVDWHNGQGTYVGSHAAFNSSYAALYYPWVKVYDQYNGQYVFTPPSGHVLAVYAYTDYSTESWFAPAGLNRGRVISGVDVEYGPTPGEMDLLYGDGNAVNPLARFTKDGIVVWGQRTLQRKPSALDRVNVRRLLLYLRKVISTAVRYLVFEPNDEKTWNLFGHLVIPFLNDVRQRRGLYDFRVKCDESTNPPAVIDRNQMNAQIFLKPVKAAEFIQVDLVITSTGANFDEVIY